MFYAWGQNLPLWFKCIFLLPGNGKDYDNNEFFPKELPCCADHEILWVQLQPSHLPRGFSSLIAAVVYHPHWTGKENDSMRDHLFQSLTAAESRYPQIVPLSWLLTSIAWPSNRSRNTSDLNKSYIHT